MDVAAQDPLDRCPLEFRAEDTSAVCLPPVLAHRASRCILRPHGEQSKWGALYLSERWQTVKRSTRITAPTATLAGIEVGRAKYEYMKK